MTCSECQSVVGVWTQWSSGPALPFHTKNPGPEEGLVRGSSTPGASLGSPRQGRVPTGRAVTLGEKPGPGENVSDFLRLGPEPLFSFRSFHRAFICAPSGYCARNQGLWAGPAGSCGNSCVHLPNLMLLQQACQTHGWLTGPEFDMLDLQPPVGGFLRLE